MLGPLALPAAASAFPGPLVSDSTDALAWARRVTQVRVAVEQAEQERDPARQAALAEAAFADARLLAASDADAHRRLLLRAQALYEVHHGGTSATALSPAELTEVRREALSAAADLSAGAFWLDAGAPDALPTRRTAARQRPGVPAHLAVPLAAEPLVEAQARIVERRFAGVRRRTRHYFPMIERTLGRRGLPHDLKYVAVIESALNPEAESHAGAAGLWQFMPETAADFGLDSLTVRDPARATDAAARFLGRLHRMFRGDWQLALAAYNSGPGRVSRIVRAFETETGRYPTFWDIHAELPRETQDYVPRFIAVARWFEPPRAL